MAILAGIRSFIEIGDLEIVSLPTFHIKSNRFASTTTAKLVVNNVTPNLSDRIKLNDPVRIAIGYRDHDPVIWDFTVDDIQQTAPDVLDIIAVTEDIALTKTKIKQIWQNELPQNIMRYFINMAGLLAGDIQTPPRVVMERFIASNHSVWRLSKIMEITLAEEYGADMTYWTLWQNSKGMVNWSPEFETPETLYTLATGEGIINHYINNRKTSVTAVNNSGLSLNFVETFLLPEIQHSQMIRIQDNLKDVGGLFPIINVEHVFSGTKARSLIWYVADEQ